MSGQDFNKCRLHHMLNSLKAVLLPLAAGLLVLLTLLGLVGTAIRDPRPHDLPVGLVGPPAATEQLSSGLTSGAPGAFSFTTFASEDAARAALDQRQIIAAVILGPRPRLVVAGAAGDTVTTVIMSVFGGVFARQGLEPDIETVHPFQAGDPHGVILFFVVVAILISSLVAAAVAGIRAGGGMAAQLIGLAAYAGLGAGAAMGVATWLTGAYGDSFWAAAGLLALTSIAVGSVVAGAAALAGAPGVALTGIGVVLLGLVASGGPVGSQLLPDFYRAVAPWLPAGALLSALKGALFYGGVGTGEPVVVLTGWLLVGLLLMLIAQAARRRRATDAP
jgi:hypothetical protein